MDVQLGNPLRQHLVVYMHCSLETVPKLAVQAAEVGLQRDCQCLPPHRLNLTLLVFNCAG